MRSFLTLTRSCTCPAGIFARKGEEKPCKHTLYVLHNVLKAPNHLKQQHAFITSELKEIFSKAPALPSQVAEDEPLDGNRKPIEDDCPICCMEFEDDEEITWCRAACGNNIHTGCFDAWAKTKAGKCISYCQQGAKAQPRWIAGCAAVLVVRLEIVANLASIGNVTCPFCRTPWEYGNAPKIKASVTNVAMPNATLGGSGYLNVRDQLDYD